MTEDVTGWGDPPEVAQPQDRLASQRHARLVQPGGRHRRPVPAWLLILGRLAARHPYLAVTACLAGSLFSAGLAVTDITDYPNGVGYLAILSMITGAVGGFAAVAMNVEKLPGWVYRINIVAVGLALISVFILVLFFPARPWWQFGLG